MRATLLGFVALAKTVSKEDVSKLSSEDCAVEDAAAGSICWIEDGTELKSKEGTPVKGGLFIRSVSKGCMGCQVQNIGDFTNIGSKHIANLVEAERKVLVRPMVELAAGGEAEGPATFELVSNVPDAKGKTQFCFCKVPFAAQRLGDAAGAKPRMKSAISFKGNDLSDTCNALECYKKYVYYAERYVKGVAPYTTAMYLLETARPGVDANEGAWNRACCAPNAEGCRITGSEAEGYQLDGGVAAPEGATITSVGELHDTVIFDGPELATDGNSDIVSFEYRCKPSFCQVDGVGNAMHECVMSHGATTEVVAASECADQGLELPTCDMDAGPVCLVKREDGALKACAVPAKPVLGEECEMECVADPETVDSVLTLMMLSPFGLS